jgi:predicted phosphodiesterase
MGIADQLSQPTAKETQYRPRTEFDGQSGFIQTGPLAEAPKSHSEILELFGYNPAEVRIVGAPRVSKWQTYDERWLSSYRFNIEPIHHERTTDLTGLIGRHKAHKPQEGGPAAFTFQASDLQIGKVDGDGTEGTVARFLDSIDIAVTEYKALRKRRSIGLIHVTFPGDCIEGNVSQNGRNMWRTELTITEQMRLFRRLMLHTVERFAPLTDELLLDVVNGNHDQAQRFQETRPDDGHATEQAIAIDDALKLNQSAFGHVKVRVPPKDQSYMTVPVGSSVFTVAHGHQWRRDKAMDWIANQALNGTNVSAAQFLVHGHTHEWSIRSTANRTVIASPAYDGGSLWLANGSSGRRGGLTYVTRDGELTDLRLV